MKNIKSVPAACVFMLALSCSKENLQKTSSQSLQSTSQEIATAECTAGVWRGIYANGDTPGENYDTVTTENFVRNGIAWMKFSPYDFYYSSLELDIPQCHTFSGDSTRLEVSLKNPSSQPYIFHDYDVIVTLIGTKDTAIVYFTSWAYNYAKIGSITHSNKKALIHVFEDYEKVVLETRNETMNVYIGPNGDQIVGSVFYGTRNKIGKVKSIHVGFKGGGSVHGVKFLNSATGGAIMYEDFTKTGQSNIIWY
ncbi:hypothetical protein I5907_15815 [Panacibacter sp. DH6]|uniref:Uncharacterized protein n=1 Tax=Panacibacter microcysteis TaxID=2793269 RepID=A0A931EB23_9BACT|nr:hypothetical protein [Panacibacter microcysteis]MBG9377709.1 hypothetical protein [Panacibacter microcysteis]